MKVYKELKLSVFFIFLCSGMMAQEIGLQLYSLREQFKTDVEGTLEMISDLGIEKLEGGETYGMPLEDFQDLLQEYNLDVVSVGASFEELQNNPEIAIQRAEDFDADYIMCAWIPHKDAFKMSDAKNAIKVFNSAGKLAKEAGLTLVYHPHGYEFARHGNGTLFDVMAKEANDFAFEMDVYWVAHGGADPMEVLNTYPDKFKLMHLKDMKPGVKGNLSGHEDVETNVVLGSGSLDIAALVDRAKELKIPYLFIEDESSKVVEQLPKSLHYLEGLNKM